MRIRDWSSDVFSSDLSCQPSRPIRKSPLSLCAVFTRLKRNPCAAEASSTKPNSETASPITSISGDPLRRLECRTRSPDIQPFCAFMASQPRHAERTRQRADATTTGLQHPISRQIHHRVTPPADLGGEGE